MAGHLDFSFLSEEAGNQGEQARNDAQAETGVPPVHESSGHKPPPTFTNPAERPPMHSYEEEPAASHSSSFSVAFAHIKETSSYVPPAPPKAMEGPIMPPPKPPNPRAILVSRRQKGNPVLNCIKNVPWEYSDIAADYQMGSTSQTCALFLSVRYHMQKSTYIYGRMQQLQKGFKLRVLLCLVDQEECQKTLLDVHMAALVNGWTLILCWSPEEAARYLETYQTYEHKQADSIQERVEGDYMSRLTDVLTTVRSINRTDVVTLSTSLGSLKSLMTASKERLSLCPGVGAKKVQRLHEAFNQPFLVRKKSRTDDDAPMSVPQAGGTGASGSKAALAESKTSSSPMPD